MPLLKETRDSLRIFFAFAAALSLRPAGAEIDYGNSSALALVPRFVETTFAVMFLYIAIRFEKLLPKPTLIKGVLVVSMVLSVCNFAVSLRSGVQVSSIVGLILSLLLSVYLLKSVTRLSKEVASRTA